MKINKWAASTQGEIDRNSLITQNVSASEDKICPMTTLISQTPLTGKSPA